MPLRSNVHHFRPSGSDSDKSPNSDIIQSSHSSGDGGGGMESRIARLESDVEHIKAGITEIKESLRLIASDSSSIRVDVGSMKSTCATKDDVAPLKSDIAVIKGNYVTKDDITPLKSDLAVVKENYVKKWDLVKALMVTAGVIATLVGTISPVITWLLQHITI